MRRVLQRFREPKKALLYYGGKAVLAAKPRRMPLLPVAIDVEPINVCNLRCDHCQVTHREAFTKEILTPASFRHILAQFPNLATVKLQGMGEPFLNPHLPDLALEAEKRGVAVSVVTNGTIDAPEPYARLQRVNKLTISVSLDGAHPATQQAIRPGSSFDTVVRTIERLVQGRRQGQTVTVTTVLTSKNAAELREIVRLAKGLGVDLLCLQTVLIGWGKETMERLNSGIRVADADLAEIVRSARAEAAACGLKLNVMEKDRYDHRATCPWPWRSVFISAGGEVVPCCMIGDPETVSFGNLFQTPFSTIWNSPQYRLLRKNIAAHRLPHYCRGCYAAAPEREEK